LSDHIPLLTIEVFAPLLCGANEKVQCAVTT
jgi:hypothetical protein